MLIRLFSYLGYYNLLYQLSQTDCRKNVINGEYPLSFGNMVLTAGHVSTQYLQDQPQIETLDSWVSSKLPWTKTLQTYCCIYYWRKEHVRCDLRRQNVGSLYWNSSSLCDVSFFIADHSNKIQSWELLTLSPVSISSESSNMWTILGPLSYIYKNL